MGVRVIFGGYGRFYIRKRLTAWMGLRRLNIFHLIQMQRDNNPFVQVHCNSCKNIGGVLRFTSVAKKRKEKSRSVIKATGLHSRSME